MMHFISVIIPNHNGSATLAKCLEAAFKSDYENFEIIVVDDGSEDGSMEIIKKFPCRLIRLEQHTGASKARNLGALNSRGDILFFTDADCLLEKNTLFQSSRTILEAGKDVIVGGTYTPSSYDASFFSGFQSIFINFSETKKLQNPDYIATHAMAMDAASFSQHGGFSENFLPILEDVEFSHRMRRSGKRLVMNSAILVQHIFNYTLFDSLRNAVRKSMYWTIYSINNKDLLTDSGTASLELKFNVISGFINICLLVLWIILQKSFLLAPLLLIGSLNIFFSRKLLNAFLGAKGFTFAVFAGIYYTLIYSLAVGAGAIAGVINYNRWRKHLEKK
jgi:glycosyltransferase involved in cell wall biosynthesis